MITVIRRTEYLNIVFGLPRMSVKLSTVANNRLYHIINNL